MRRKKSPCLYEHELFLIFNLVQKIVYYFSSFFRQPVTAYGMSFLEW